MQTLNALELTGRARTHVCQLDELKAALHRDAVNPFLDMRAAAAHEGIDIAVASSFRDFDAQLRIWNKKFSGERTLYDAQGAALDYGSLTEPQIVEAILCWSALPGASRHHWGTEIDVIDRAALGQDGRYELLPQEAEPGGVFYRLHQWLDANIARFGFYRPYDVYRGGVNPEAWHLSYAPVSSLAIESMTLDVLREAVAGADLLGKERVLDQLDAIARRYVFNVAPAPTAFA
jgi:LAS superfamily LD-carboxypeptidase LdcB